MNKAELLGYVDGVNDANQHTQKQFKFNTRTVSIEDSDDYSDGYWKGRKAGTSK